MRTIKRRQLAQHESHMTPEQRASAKLRRLYRFTDLTPAGRYLKAKGERQASSIIGNQ